MCWKCDAITPPCPLASVESIEDYILCGPCDVEPETEADFPEIFPTCRSVAIQCGSSHTAEQAEHHRAPPLKRALESGTTGPNAKIRASRLN